MQRIDFYILSAQGARAREQFACRLTEKAYQLDNCVHLRVDDQPAALSIDELLWTFRDASFVPHQILTDNTASAPVTIGIGPATPAKTGLLINLGNDVPENLSDFSRLAELVDTDTDRKQQCRERFAWYKSQGYAVHSHNIR